LCGKYLCDQCSKNHGFFRNLDDSNPTYCPKCYEDETEKDALKAKQEKQLLADSEAYKEARPKRDLDYVDPPEPHTVLANLSSDKLWSGGPGQGPMTKRPLNLHTYTSTEVNGMLKTIRNQFMDLPGWQEPFFVVEDRTRPQDLTVAECKHHFDKDTVDMILLQGYVVHKGRFVTQAEKDKFDPDASSDDSDQSDCDLKD
jgi:hypothetical protein